jgi:hypothetical protein
MEAFAHVVFGNATGTQSKARGVLEVSWGECDGDDIPNGMFANFFSDSPVLFSAASRKYKEQLLETGLEDKTRLSADEGGCRFDNVEIKQWWAGTGFTSSYAQYTALFGTELMVSESLWATIAPPALAAYVTLLKQLRRRVWDKLGRCLAGHGLLGEYYALYVDY